MSVSVWKTVFNFAQYSSAGCIEIWSLSIRPKWIVETAWEPLEKCEKLLYFFLFILAREGIVENFGIFSMIYLTSIGVECKTFSYPQLALLFIFPLFLLLFH